jgi:hypothetical protein
MMTSDNGMLTDAEQALWRAWLAENEKAIVEQDFWPWLQRAFRDGHRSAAPLPELLAHAERWQKELQRDYQLYLKKLHEQYRRLTPYTFEEYCQQANALQDEYKVVPYEKP